MLSQTSSPRLRIFISADPEVSASGPQAPGNTCKLISSNRRTEIASNQTDREEEGENARDRQKLGFLSPKGREGGPCEESAREEGCFLPHTIPLDVGSSFLSDFRCI